MGYRSDATLPTPDDYSILPRSLNDQRYALKSEIGYDSQLLDDHMQVIIDSTVNTQPELNLNYRSEPNQLPFLKFKRTSDLITQVVSNPLLIFQNNQLTPYTVSVNNGF